MPLDILVGAQWGDEGKGRYVDLLAGGADYVARYAGGDNAGHTVNVGDRTFKLHLLPSGLIHPDTGGLLGNGMVINPDVLREEMEELRQAGVPVSPDRLRISHAAHLITPGHLALDAAEETARGADSLGTTQRGIGPAYTDKVARRGLRVALLLDHDALTSALREHLDSVNRRLADLFEAEPVSVKGTVEAFVEHARELAPYVGDVSGALTEALRQGRRVLAEGAQGTLLDLDHGTYPFVTSSHPTAGGALVGLGVGPRHVGRVIGVTKSFQTRVGAGPFPTEVEDPVALHLRGTGDQPWDEFGTTTGRPRRVGWLDLVLLRYAVRVNGLTELALTKLDVLAGLETLTLCTAYRAKGELYRELPLGPGSLSRFEPVYEEMPGWDQDIQHVRRWMDLPAAARAYVKRVVDLAGTPVHLVSVGPERHQVVETG